MENIRKGEGDPAGLVSVVVEAADTPPPSARAEARPTPPWGALWADGRVGKADVVEEEGRERTGTKANGGDREGRRERHARGFRRKETTDRMRARRYRKTCERGDAPVADA